VLVVGATLAATEHCVRSLRGKGRQPIIVVIYSWLAGICLRLFAVLLDGVSQQIAYLKHLLLAQ
jgi:hypothetical protein